MGKAVSAARCLLVLHLPWLARPSYWSQSRPHRHLEVQREELADAGTNKIDGGDGLQDEKHSLELQFSVRTPAIISE